MTNPEINKTHDSNTNNVEMNSSENIGSVSVDSGNLIIVDPGYLQSEGLLPTDAYIDLSVGFSRPVDYDNLSEYTKLLDEDRRKKHAPILGGLGISLIPGFGDGKYNVSVTRTDEGRIAKVEIVFVDKEKPSNE